LKYKTEVWLIGIICWNKNRILVYSKLSVIKNKVLVQRNSLFTKFSVIKTGLWFNEIICYKKQDFGLFKIFVGIKTGFGSMKFFVGIKTGFWFKEILC